MSKYHPNNIIGQIRKAYDPMHPIEVTMTCKTCGWKDSFTVKPSRSMKNK